MERLYIEIKSERKTKTPKKGLGIKAEVTGITKEQYQILQSMAWYLNNRGYFRTKLYVPYETTVYLHQIVNNMRYGIEPLWDNTYTEYGLEIDHIDNNPLNCRPDNLQYLTEDANWRKQNKKGKSSQYRGVFWNKKRNKWVAQYKLKGKQYHLGLFDDELEASRAYQDKLTELGLH
jgi:hypothetical protein